MGKKNGSDSDTNITKDCNENEEFSQYTLTQLLSLINSTESNEITGNNENTANTLGVPKQSTPKRNMSSDDEIEPTPPKRRIPSTSKFFYRSNSFNSNSDSVHKNNAPKDKLEILSCPPTSFNISFDLSDMQSPQKHGIDTAASKQLCESSKETLKPFENLNKGNRIYLNGRSRLHASNSTPIKAKVSSSFDFPDKKSTECDNTKLEHSVLDKNNCKDESKPCQTNITNNPTNSLSNISFDLSDMQFPQLDEKKDDNVKNFVKPENPSPINIYDENQDEHSSVFENAAAENIFFDISFDFPDLQDVSSQKELPTGGNNNVTENIVLDAFEDYSKNIQFSKNSLISDNCPSKNQSISLNNDTLKASSNSSKSFENGMSKTASMTQNSNNSKTANKNIFNKFIVNDLDLSNSEDFILPQKLNYKKNKIVFAEANDKQRNCLEIRNSNSKNSNPETFSKTCKYKRVENVTSEYSVDKNANSNFKRPLNKLSRTSTKSKKKKTNTKNDLLLSQASVSGSDSSGGDDEDLDFLEESFIDDNTVLESPPNQHCMYLESVKNVAGLPQKYKLKATEGWANSGPVDEGCSKYLLDSFCVDDEEVVYTCSDDELEIGRKKTKTNKVRKKRKRIITFNESSSDEEQFVKKVKTPEKEEFMKKVTPISSNEHKPKFCKKVKQKFITSSDEDGEVPPPEKHSKKQFNGKANAELPVKSTNSETELVEKNHDLSDTDLNCANFSFDLEWDDAISPSQFPVNKCDEIIMQNESKRDPVPSTTNIRDETSIFRHQAVSANSHLFTTVDSRELASGKPVISALRNKYGMNPFVMQLSAADYIISNKIAVERILDSDFSSSAIPLKIIEKVKAMSEQYEKSFVIIEIDSRKRSMGFNKSSTKYLQFSVHICHHPSVKVLYSNSVDDTCNLLHSLYEKEKQKSLHINVPVALNSSSQKLFNFYNSLPHVSPVCALNFTYYFPSVHGFFKSSAEQLKNAGFISSHKAKAIIQYLKSELLFDAYS
ncbi:Fanconi anemia group M protein like [Argiope bruennichi]|uniref:Fanconi anemia group M protein like n=1 Tax=Argiope bruennichi TaxID=94029 RepID=A0A8T0E5B7_ARGBR|nr:Fanconi anemia group M protein like [Argiope bruennichi]